MRRGFLAMLALPLLAAGARAQVVQHWLPARVELHGTLLADKPRLQVIEGLPGELMTARVVSKASGPAVAWAVDLLQPDQPTKTFLAGPGGAIELDPVLFGTTGAVALRLRSLDGSGGKYVLRGHSKLPAGWRHPQVDLLGDQPGTYHATLPLRPGLTLRLRVGLPHKAQGWPQESVPQLLVTPPALVGPAHASGFSLPGEVSGKPYPDLVKLHTSCDVSEVQLDVGAGGLKSVDVRVRSHKTVLGKVPKNPSAGPDPGSQPAAASPIESVQLDADEALPGDSVHLAAEIKAWSSVCPEPKTSVRVWLSSIHRIDFDEFGGWLLAGPVELPLLPEGSALETDLQVPGDVPPGLYGVWVVLDEPEGPIFTCDNLLHGQRAATVLRVREP